MSEEKDAATLAAEANSATPAAPRVIVPQLEPSPVFRRAAPSRDGASVSCA